MQLRQRSVARKSEFLVFVVGLVIGSGCGAGEQTLSCHYDLRIEGFLNETCDEFEGLLPEQAHDVEFIGCREGVIRNIPSTLSDGGAGPTGEQTTRLIRGRCPRANTEGGCRRPVFDGRGGHATITSYWYNRPSPGVPALDGAECWGGEGIWVRN